MSPFLRLHAPREYVREIRLSDMRAAVPFGGNPGKQAETNMAIHLNFNAKAAEAFAEKKPSVHYMPCLIKSDGPANVSKYFKPVENEKDPKCKDYSLYRNDLTYRFGSCYYYYFKI